MNKYIKIIGGIVIVGVILAFIIMGNRISKLNESIGTYDNNFKALNLENDRLSKEAIAYKFSAEQLEYINDSIIEDLNNTRKQLGIKDKQLKQMQSIKTEIITRDSIFFRDTIFRDNLPKIDTLLGDEWYKIHLELEYPSTIKIDAKYISDLSVFAYSSKEIIGTPKKCFIGRWFQKKHRIIRVDVDDKNPNAIIKEKKFIIIE